MGKEDRFSPSENVGIFSVCAAVVAGPVALGGTGCWARLAIETLMAAGVVLWAVARPRRPLPILIPLALAGLLWLQLLPMPDRLLGAVAPVAEAAWKVAWAGLGHRWGTVSVDPASTANAICRMLLAVATLAAVADVSRRAWCRRVFAGALATTCIVIWTLGLVFPFDKSLVLLGAIDCKGPIEAEFWKTPLVPPIATNGSGNLDWVTAGGQRYATATWIAADGFGPYIYANHFAGAMCLVVPAALAGFFVISRDSIPSPTRHVIVGLVLAAALWTVGVMATSRAGGAALLFGTIVFFSLTLKPGWLRTTFCALTLLYAAAIVVLTLAMYGAFGGLERAFPVALQPRIAALMSDGRTVAARVAFRMFTASPLLGSGLSTFGELFTRFLRGDALLGYAHNDYAQWLAETGLLGFGIAATILWRLSRSFWNFLLTDHGPDHTLAAGAWAGLAGLGIHSAFDWNLHIPANALLACIVAGMAIASGEKTTATLGNPKARKPPALARWPGLALATACVIAMVFLARDAMTENAQRRLREAIVAARLEAADASRPPAGPKLRAAIAGGERMARWDRGNAQLAVLLGQAFLHLSTEPQPIDDASSQLASADAWFQAARKNSAACSGLPEPATANGTGRRP